MRYIMSGAVWLLLTCSAWAQLLTLPAEVKGEPGAFITVPAKTECEVVRWVALDSGIQLFPTQLLRDSKTAVVIAQKPGKYRLLAYTASKTGQPSEPAICCVCVGDPEPGPGPKPPPGPGPEPPPDPEDEAPIPLAGFRVLIVYETADLGKDKRLSDTIYSSEIRNWLSDNCVVGSDGKTREWRMFDKDISLAGAAQHWVDAMKRKRDAVPWILISNGKTGYEGNLPHGAEATMALLKKWKGK